LRLSRSFHLEFAQGAKDVIFSAQPWVQQFPTGCSNNSTPPNGDAAADRVINVLAHEIEEATTDPDLNAWFDASGQENADKCAWMFGTTFNNGTGLANMTIGAKDFLIQMNWVNSGQRWLPPGPEWRDQPAARGGLFVQL
jgi:hypothetical protein